VRAISRLALVGWLVVTAGGCAGVSGLDGLSEKDCAPSCSDAQDIEDGTVEALADAPGNQDRGPADSPGEAAAAEDGSRDAGADQASGDSGGANAESGSPARGDASSDGPSPEASFDSGCGPLNTPTNCSACTDICAAVPTAETSSSCSGDTTGVGASCSYTCASGYEDCNAASVPNLDGCECHVPGATQAQCCLGAGTCPVPHDNGLNQTGSRFFDCEATGQLTLALATDACAAFTGDPTQCTPEVCEAPDGSADGDRVVCSAGSGSDCVCWTYQGANAGYLHDPGQPASAGCFCANSAIGDPRYD
jgi:hypothetical protein